MLNYTKKLIRVRKDNKDLYANNNEFEIIKAGYPFIYKRGNIVVLINPKDTSVSVKVDNAKECIISVNATLVGETVSTYGKGAAIILL